jgi:hypothetical protein
MFLSLKCPTFNVVFSESYFFSVSLAQYSQNGNFSAYHCLDVSRTAFSPCAHICIHVASVHICQLTFNWLMVH